MSPELLQIKINEKLSPTHIQTIHNHSTGLQIYDKTQASDWSLINFTTGNVRTLSSSLDIFSFLTLDIQALLTDIRCTGPIYRMNL